MKVNYIYLNNDQEEVDRDRFIRQAHITKKELADKEKYMKVMLRSSIMLNSKIGLNINATHTSMRLKNGSMIEATMED